MAKISAEAAVVRVCEHFNLKLTGEQIDSLVQFIKFGLIGVTNTVISYVLNAGTLLLLSPLKLS
ncbi:MAG TPA: hypothetical protein DCZ71_06335, partial [Ruminococcus sp.]|nr:hypothetical protein [Ruminococcus sp.]